MLRGGFLASVLVAGALVGCNQGGGDGEGGNGAGGGEEQAEFALPPVGLRLRTVRSTRRAAPRVRRSSSPA